MNIVREKGMWCRRRRLEKCTLLFIFSSTLYLIAVYSRLEVKEKNQTDIEPLRFIPGKLGRVTAKFEGGVARYNLQHNYTIEDLMKSVDPSDYAPIHLNFVELRGTCTSPIKMLPQFRSPCWSKCTSSECSTNDVKRGDLVCAPRVILMGFTKCGTTDIWAWFGNHSSVIDYHTNYDLILHRAQCGRSFATSSWLSEAVKEKLASKMFSELETATVYLHAPGQLTHHFLYKREGNVFQITHSIQLFQEFETEDTKYIVALCDPSTRVIMQIFDWQQSGRNFQGWKTDNITAQVIHDLVATQLQRVKQCFLEYSPKGCILKSQGLSVDMNTMLLRGLYVEYLELAFRFSHQKKWHFIHLSEYSSNEVETMKSVFEFVGLPYENRGSSEKTIRNQLKFQPNVYPETFLALRKFFRPFNERLSVLLNDKKWLFDEKQQQSKNNWLLPFVNNFWT